MCFEKKNELFYFFKQKYRVSDHLSFESAYRLFYRKLLNIRRVLKKGCIWPFSEYGTILKALSTTDKSLQGCYLEEIRILPVGRVGPVRSLKILGRDRSLFVGLDDRLVKLPLQRCSSYPTERWDSWRASSVRTGQWEALLRTFIGLTHTHAHTRQKFLIFQTLRRLFFAQHLRCFQSCSQIVSAK